MTRNGVCLDILPFNRIFHQTITLILLNVTPIPSKKAKILP